MLFNVILRNCLIEKWTPPNIVQTDQIYVGPRLYKPEMDSELRVGLDMQSWYNMGQIHVGAGVKPELELWSRGGHLQTWFNKGQIHGGPGVDKPELDQGWSIVLRWVNHN